MIDPVQLAIEHLVAHGAWHHTIVGRSLCAAALWSIRSSCLTKRDKEKRVFHLRQICGSLPFRPRDLLSDGSRAKKIFPPEELARMKAHRDRCILAWQGRWPLPDGLLGGLRHYR